MIISHGISIYPYKYSTKYLIRFLLWSPYLFLLKKIIKKNNVFMSLDVNSKSNRNLDTKLAKLYNKEIVTYNNFSRYEKINFEEDLENKEEKILLCIGYVNHIKNQIDLIEVAKKLKDTKIKIKIIYNFYNKNYLNKLLKKIKKNNLSNISLFSDKDIDIKKEINNCWSLINTSITEVSPLSLIEGNSLNKIFFSYNVGNLDKFSGNLTNNNLDQMIFNIKSVDKNLFF